jgi:hypothetical protein
MVTAALGLSSGGTVMAVSRQLAHVAILISALAWSSAATAMDGPSAADVVPMAPDARVRGMTDRLLTLINDATIRSKTFRALVDGISATDGVLFVLEGRCPRAVRACLLWTISTMGSHRVLRILVDARDSDVELAGSIGHELHHALEVFSHRHVTTESGIAALYQRIGGVRGLAIETEAAIKAGDAVREELRQRRGR